MFWERTGCKWATKCYRIFFLFCFYFKVIQIIARQIWKSVNRQSLLYDTGDLLRGNTMKSISVASYTLWQLGASALATIVLFQIYTTTIRFALCLYCHVSFNFFHCSYEWITERECRPSEEMVCEAWPSSFQTFEIVCFFSFLIVLY